MHIITDLLMQFSLYFALLLFFFRYILTLSDYFSKWVEAVATPSKEAHQVASAHSTRFVSFNSLTCASNIN